MTVAALNRPPALDFLGVPGIGENGYIRASRRSNPSARCTAVSPGALTGKGLPKLLLKGQQHTFEIFPGE
jgi:hypothetical protein